MSEKKKPTTEEDTKKTEVAVTAKKAPVTSKPRGKPTALAPSRPMDLWRAFDDVFETFRRDFEDLLYPSS